MNHVGNEARDDPSTVKGIDPASYMMMMMMMIIIMMKILWLKSLPTD